MSYEELTRIIGPAKIELFWLSDRDNNLKIGILYDVGFIGGIAIEKNIGGLPKRNFITPL